MVMQTVRTTAKMILGIMRATKRNPAESLHR